MQEKFCCAEMKELVKGYRSGGNVKMFFTDGENVEEMCVADGSIPNILFRFCPYCGAQVQNIEVKKDDTPVGRLSSVLFNSDLDDQRSSLQARAYLMLDAIEQARKILRTSSVAGTKPGLFKVS
jgi:hypothetical protein